MASCFPSGLAAGVHSLTVAEGTLEAGSLTATTTFYVPGGTATGGTGPSGNVGPNTERDLLWVDRLGSRYQHLQRCVGSACRLHRG